ncbi:hypothetical protein I4U23_023488 [Adineta vaga]|nr:hypothetical protein I4U23_023488 [Adineta vaga]
MYALLISLFLLMIDTLIITVIHRSAIYQPISSCNFLRNVTWSSNISIQSCIWECVYEKNCQTAVYFKDDNICSLFTELCQTNSIQSSGNIRASVICHRKNHVPDNLCSSIATSTIMSTTPLHSGMWYYVGNMTSVRSFHTSTFIAATNAVLIIGGNDGSSDLPSTEIFHLSNRSFIRRGDTSQRRQFHIAESIDSHLVLLVGGWSSLRTAELYDSVAGVSNKTINPTVARASPASAVFNDNKNISAHVLLVGGKDESGVLASGDIFNTTTGIFIPVGNNMISTRSFHTATVIDNGYVLLAGGINNNSIFLDSLELYNSTSNLFVSLPMRMSIGRAHHTATFIPSKQAVLFVGGLSSTGALQTYDLFNVTTFNFTVLNGSTLNARAYHSAVLLRNEQVLIIGGQDNRRLSSCELYEPISEIFIPTGNMSSDRADHSTTLLTNTGQVLVCGGQNTSGMIYHNTIIGLYDRKMNSNKCQYQLSAIDSIVCEMSAIYKCSHCSTVYCLEHGLEHQEDLREEINYLLDEAHELMAEIPLLNIESGRTNCIEQCQDWIKLILHKMKQKYKEFQIQLHELHNHVETQKDEWKTSLIKQMETSVISVFNTQLHSHEIDGIVLNKARNEFVRIQKLCNLLNSQAMITLTDIADSNFDLITPRLTLRNLIINDSQSIEKISHNNVVEENNRPSQKRIQEENTIEKSTRITNHEHTHQSKKIKLPQEDISILEDSSMMINSTSEIVFDALDQSRNNSIQQNDVSSTKSPIVTKQNSNDFSSNVENDSDIDDEDTESICSESLQPCPSTSQQQQQKRNTNQTNLSAQCLSRQETEIMIHHLMKNCNIPTALNLSRKKIGNEGAQQLSDVLKSNLNISSLDLHQNNIAADGIRYLSDALQSNTTLQSLNLAGNTFRDDVARHMGLTLKYNETLTTLNLSGNPMEDRSLKFLSDSLQRNKILTTIDLSLNHVKEEILKYFGFGSKLNDTDEISVNNSYA